MTGPGDGWVPSMFRGVAYQFSGPDSITHLLIDGVSLSLLQPFTPATADRWVYTYLQRMILP